MKFKKIFKSALVTSVLYAVAFTMLGGNKDSHFVPFFSIAVFIKTVVVMYVSFLIPVFAIYFSRKKWLLPFNNLTEHFVTIKRINKVRLKI